MNHARHIPTDAIPTENAPSNAPRWLRYTFGGLAALFLVPMVVMIVGIAAIALAPVAAVGLPFVWQGLLGFPTHRLVPLRVSAGSSHRAARSSAALAV